jgi:hypothetical protein
MMNGSLPSFEAGWLIWLSQAPARSDSRHRGSVSTKTPSHTSRLRMMTLVPVYRNRLHIIPFCGGIAQVVSDMTLVTAEKSALAISCSARLGRFWSQIDTGSRIRPQISGARLVEG